jgi:CRP/FNR family transcriptional regulator
MTCANKECPFFVKPIGNGGRSNKKEQCLVCDSVKQVSFSKGDILFSQNDPSCCVYALTSGVVKLCDVSTSGDEQIVGFSSPHKLMVGLRSLSKDTYSDSAVAETDVTACKIRKRALLTAVADEPQVAIRLIDAINSQLSMSRELMRVTEHHGAKAKIAAFLVLVVPQLNGGGSRVEFPFSRSEMAGLLSLSEETVCRQMAAMRRDGILYAPRGHMEIKNWDRLRDIADETGVHNA